MGSICDADFHHLKPGKKVVLASFEGSKIAPAYVSINKNYWRLLGTKAVVVTTSPDASRALVTFEQEFMTLGLDADPQAENSLWVYISDLKFVCRL